VSRIRSLHIVAGCLALAATLTPRTLHAQLATRAEAGPGRPAILMPAAEPEEVEPGSDITLTPGVDLTRVPSLELPAPPDIVLDHTGVLSVPSPAPIVAPVRVTVRSPPGVALVSLREAPGAEADRQCTGDCELRLAPGRYRFGLTYGLSAPVMAPGTFQLDGPDVLEASYISERRKRIGGWVLLSIGLPGGIIQLATALKAYSELSYICDPDEDCRAERLGPGVRANIVLGAITTAASAILGGWLVTRRPCAGAAARARAGRAARVQYAAARAAARARLRPVIHRCFPCGSPRAPTTFSVHVSDLPLSLPAPPHRRGAGFTGNLMLSRFLVAALVIAACLAPLPLAHAQPAPGSYDDEVAQALAAHAAGDLAAAEAHMARAHALAPSARTLRGLGIIAHARCDYPAALSLLESALGEPVRRLDGELRSSVERLLTATRLKVGRYRLELEPRDAVVSIDGAVPSRDAQGEVVLLPGSHVVALSAPGHEPKRLGVNTLGGEHSRIVVRLVPVVERPAGAPASAPPAMRQKRIVSVALLAGGGAFLVGAFGSWVVAREKQSSFFDPCEGEDDGFCESDEERRENESEARTLERASRVLGALGALGAIAGVVVWVSPQRKTASVALRGTGADLRVSF
jgi:hypothetical protein